MTGTARSGRRWPAKLLLCAASLAGAALAAELGVRAWMRLTGEPYSVWLTQQTVKETVARMMGVDPENWKPRELDSGFAFHPYTGRVSVAVEELIEQAALHFAEAPDEDDYDVFVFGGSVAVGFTGGLGAETLKRRLEDAPWLGGRAARIWRFAVSASKQPQQLELLVYLLVRGCRPDLVINLDGLNELRIAQNNAREGSHVSWPGGGHWGTRSFRPAVDDATKELLQELRSLENRAQGIAATAFERRLLHSAVLGRFTLSRLLRIRADWARASRRYQELVGPAAAAGSVPGDDPEAVLPEAIRYWSESSILMHQVCAARGARYLHALQPTLHDRGSKPVTEQEWRVGIGEKGYHPGVVAGYPLLRQELAELGRRGVDVLDLSYAFEEVEETLYIDSCHFAGKGRLILAERIADHLDAAAREGR